MPTMILNVNGFSTPGKGQKWQAGHIKKTQLYAVCRKLTSNLTT